MAAVTAVTSTLFWRLLGASLVMLVFGFLGEAGLMDVTVGFVIGMAGWIYIIYEIFAGEAAKLSENSKNAGGQFAFNTLRLIVTVGWAIYPLGYVFGVMMGVGNDASLNLIYNLADFVNKILFGLIIWGVATKEA